MTGQHHRPVTRGITPTRATMHPEFRSPLPLLPAAVLAPRAAPDLGHRSVTARRLAGRLDRNDGAAPAVVVGAAPVGHSAVPQWWSGQSATKTVPAGTNSTVTWSPCAASSSGSMTASPGAAPVTSKAAVLRPWVSVHTGASGADWRVPVNR